MILQVPYTRRFKVVWETGVVSCKVQPLNPQEANDVRLFLFSKTPNPKP